MTHRKKNKTKYLILIKFLFLILLNVNNTVLYRQFFCFIH